EGFRNENSEKSRLRNSLRSNFLCSNGIGADGLGGRSGTGSRQRRGFARAAAIENPDRGAAETDRAVARRPGRAEADAGKSTGRGQPSGRQPSGEWSPAHGSREPGPVGFHR